MKVWSVSLPTASFTVEAPTAVGEPLRQLFPRAESAAGGAGMGFAVFPEGEHWRLEENGAFVGRFAEPGLALAAIEHRAVEIAARSAGGAVILHAGAVDVGGAACLVAGLPESGKSSTTVQLVELGHVFLADEVAVVEADGGRVFPFHRTPELGAGFVSGRFGADPPAHGELVTPAAGITRYLPLRLGEDPVPVSTLLLPSYRTGAATSVDELDTGEALTEVLGHCFEPLGDPEELVDALIALLGGWTVQRLVYGDAAAARRALAEHFPPPPPPSGTGAG